MPNWDQAAWERSKDSALADIDIQEIRSMLLDAAVSGFDRVQVSVIIMNALLDEVLAARGGVKGVVQ